MYDNSSALIIQIGLNFRRKIVLLQFRKAVQIGFQARDKVCSRVPRTFSNIMQITPEIIGKLA